MTTISNNKFSDNLSLEDIRKMMFKFTNERNWHKFHTPRNLLMALVGEVGELSEIFQWKGEVKPGLEEWNDKEKEHLGEEISDVLLYLVRLADVCKIDLSKAVVDKMKKNNQKHKN